MERETVDDCLRAIDVSGAHTVDLTGGAPELNPHFRYLVDECVRRGKHVIDRCNLTILMTRRFADLPSGWPSGGGSRMFASALPAIGYGRISGERGPIPGALPRSGTERSGVRPGGCGPAVDAGDESGRGVLAASQQSLEREWKEALARNHGIAFDRLIALNNMPMSRYLEWLADKGLVEEYMHRIVQAFNPAAIAGLMCRNTLSVSWDGYLYDCDFNQQA